MNPEEHPVYDPQTNFRVGSSFSGGAQSYTQSTSRDEYNGNMYQPHSDSYALKYPPGYGRQPHGQALAFPSEHYPSAQNQAPASFTPQYGQYVSMPQDPPTSYAVNQYRPPFPPPTQEQLVLVSPPHDYSRQLQHVNQASKFQGEVPHQAALSGVNHSIGWTPRSAEYQRPVFAKDEAKFSEPSIPFARPKKRGSPRKSGMLSVKDLLNNDIQASSFPSSNPHNVCTDHNSFLHPSVSILSNVAHESMKDRGPLENKVVLKTPSDEAKKTIRLCAEVNPKPEVCMAHLEKRSGLLVSKKPTEVPSIIASQKNVMLAACKHSEGDDVPLGGVPRKTRLKEEPAPRRQGAQLFTDDIHSTIPLKKSKFASSRETNTVPMKLASTKCSKVAKATKKRGNLKEKKRKVASYSLIVHSGDESDGVLRTKVVPPNGKRNPPATLITHSDEEDFEDNGSLSKERNSSVRQRINDAKNDERGTTKSRTSRKRSRERKEGTRKSPRLGKRKDISAPDPARKLSKQAKVIHKNERKTKMTKSLDELPDSNEIEPDPLDSDDDFVPTSERGKLFAAQKAKWLKTQKTKDNVSRTPKKGAKQSTKTRPTKRKRVQKGNASDGDYTDSRVDDQTSDSDSQNPSQRGSQPLEVKITSLSTKRRRRKTFEEERKRLTEIELSTIRLAFVAHYPPPPSNAQAQGRFEMRYGHEMSEAMIQGLWEKELKHWSERWWKFYTGFNDFAREKKLAKPVDKNPTITKKEAETWAQSFYTEHGNARVPAVVTKSDESKSKTSEQSESPKSQNDATANLGEHDKPDNADSVPDQAKVIADSQKVSADNANVFTDLKPVADHDQTSTGSQVAIASDTAENAEIKLDKAL
ncbi:unnamed protein product [Agarophyton chilense]